MENSNDELLYEIKFKNFFDRFLNNSYFRIILFFEILSIIISIFFIINHMLFTPLIILSILIVINYSGNYKIKLFKNKIEFPNSRLTGGTYHIEIKYEDITGYHLKNNNSILIFHKLNEERNSHIILRKINEENMKNILNIFKEKKIKQLTTKGSIYLFKKTIQYKLFFILPITILIDIGILIILSIILYPFIF